MSFADQFEIVDGAVGPQPWMQLRAVATGSADSVSKTYDPTDGWAKNDTLQTVTVTYTNTTPVAQWVYGMVSKSGSQVTLQCRSRAYISTGHAVWTGASGGTPSLTTIEVSRFGVGTDLGAGGILSIGGAFAISELRGNSATIPLMPHVTQWYLVGAGQKFAAQVVVKFVSEKWENTLIDGGDGNTESKVITGDLRVDLFAVPSVSVPLPRLTPTVVGGGSNVKYDRQISTGFTGTQTTVLVPTGTAAGDVLVAIVCNNQSVLGAVGPVASGWTLLHDRNAGILGGELDVHMRMYIRTATASEPASYLFTNSLLAEQTAVIMAIRNSVPYESALGLDWYVSTNVSSYKFVEEQVAPSIGRDGQLLLGVSFFAHALIQSPITQTPPSGMTELVDIPGAGTTLEICSLTGPPNPTLERKFTPSAVPVFSGHSITAAILIPGAQNFA